MATSFYVEKSYFPSIKGELYLRDYTGHCHSLSSVNFLLENEIFRTSNPQLIPIFEKAKKMMENNEVGSVVLE